MVERIITDVLQMMEGKGDLKELKMTLYCILSRYEIHEKTTELQVINNSWEKSLDDFLSWKRVGGRSKKTLDQYAMHLRRMLTYLNKPVEEIVEADLYRYFSVYKKTRPVSNGYLNGIRAVFSSFFGTMLNKGYISKNPVAGLEPIKTETRIKKPLSGKELVKLRQKCNRERDLALIEFLYGTGVRVSELVALNRSDIDFEGMNVVVYGKGSKERETYLTEASCYHLKEYLDSRTDDNEALFVSLKSPHQRLTIAGIEDIVRKLGRKTGVDNVHPHRFRRTMATNALNKGMRLEEVKELLGHVKLDTTMIYCTISKENVKHSHRKYMSA